MIYNERTRLVFVGGFLGAGKTSLIYEVSRKLASEGRQIALITNDQAPGLFDTALLGHTGLTVEEVSGSCFCCDFKALRRSIEKAGENMKKDIIIAEPVGSCTDLTATLIKPIQSIMNREISISPLTVLADPARIRQILGFDGSAIHPSAAYIIKKQLEECEVLGITKSDLYTVEELSALSSKMKEQFPECRIMTISSKTGEGLDDWLDHVLHKESTWNSIPEIDYDRYAEGEAVLGWLNCSASLTGDEIDFDDFAKSFMQDFSMKLDSMNLNVGHVKMMIESGDQYITANLTGKPDSLSFRWSAGKGDNAEMIFNARVEMPPEELEKVFRETLESVKGRKIAITIKRLRSISPGYPKPTHRLK